MQVTGVDIYFGRGVEEDDEDPEEEEDEPDAVQEFVKKRWNLNARFREDRSDDRLLTDSFDLINSRLLAEGINADRWESYVRDLHHMLKPGHGWLQMVELQLHIQSWNGRLRADSCLTKSVCMYAVLSPLADSIARWWQWYDSKMAWMRKDPRIGRRLQQLLRNQDFADVQAGSIDLPLGEWWTGTVTSCARYMIESDKQGRSGVGGQRCHGDCAKLVGCLPVQLCPLSTKC